MSKYDQFGGIPKKPRMEGRRPPDAQTLELINLFNYLTENRGKTVREIVMDYILKDTGGTPSKVVDAWLNWSKPDGHIPTSTDTRTGIISALREMKKNPPESFLSAIKDTSSDIIKPETPVIGRPIKPRKPRFENPTTKEIIEANKRELENLMKKLRREGKIVGE